MLNDRQRVEAGIIPALMYGIVVPLAADQETEEEREQFDKVVRACQRAMFEISDDLDDKRANQVQRRLARLYAKLREVMEHASCNVQSMMAVYYLTEELIQEEKISIYDGTYFADAVNILLSSLNEYWDDERLDKMARKRARQMRKVLESEGYFR